MKTDTQHLDYLISQYVDGCLDTGSRKSLEQKLVHEPQARKLYKEQRDVQDMLDDWGNRIPMINWNQFDSELAARLQHETVGGHGSSIFRRWARPIAAAASLLVAASIGYSWHAWANPPRPQIIVQSTTPAVAPPTAAVKIDDHLASLMASFRSVKIEEPAGLHGPTADRGEVDISSPDDIAGADSLLANVRLGTAGDIKGAGAATAMQTPPEIKRDAGKESRESEPFFPYP
jgi:hypothetical protein